MKKVIIIHGCPDAEEKAMDPKTRTYDKHWIPWTKKELTSQGFHVETPLMPNPWEARYEEFKDKFEELNIDSTTTLIGHSCGCAFLVRWLGESKAEINKLILVAPWKIPDEGDKLKKAFYEYEIDESIKARVSKVIIFTADDEKPEGKKSSEIFHKALNGEVIELSGHGHYTMGDMGTIEFPELLEIISN